MPRKPLTVGDLVFKTKKSAKEYCKKLLTQTPLGVVSDPSLEKFLFHLLKRHPMADEKMRGGISHFFIHDNEYLPGKGFGVMRKDKVWSRFSYKKCIDRELEKPKQKIAKACRNAVSFDCQQAKIAYFEECEAQGIEVKCDETGETLSLEEATLDHMAPATFQMIVRCFIALKHEQFLNNKQLKQNVLTSSDERIKGYAFVDPELENEFRKYHARASKNCLRIVSAKTNSKIAAKNKIKPPKSLVRPNIVIDQDNYNMRHNHAITAP